MKIRSRYLEDIGQRVYIAAHRGSYGGNIPCNTLDAYDVALAQGADIVETDVFQTIDGELFIFHTGCERQQLGKEFDIQLLTAAQVKKLRYVNSEGAQTTHPVYSLDDCLEHLKGRCLINLDRCWDIWEDVVKSVERHAMVEQIILKSPPQTRYFKNMEKLATNCMYMPMLRDIDNCSEMLQKMDINYIGAEVIFSSEEAPIVQDDYIQQMKEKDKILWANAIVYDYNVQLAAGYNDDTSITGNADKGWGWLINKGFDIIQTDWTGMLRHYIDARDRC